MKTTIRLTAINTIPVVAQLHACISFLSPYPTQVYGQMRLCMRTDSRTELILDRSVTCMRVRTPRVSRQTEINDAFLIIRHLRLT